LLQLKWDLHQTVLKCFSGASKWTHHPRAAAGVQMPPAGSQEQLRGVTQPTAQLVTEIWKPTTLPRNHPRTASTAPQPPGSSLQPQDLPDPTDLVPSRGQGRACCFSPATASVWGEERLLRAAGSSSVAARRGHVVSTRLCHSVT